MPPFSSAAQRAFSLLVPWLTSWPPLLLGRSLALLLLPAESALLISCLLRILLNGRLAPCVPTSPVW